MTNYNLTCPIPKSEYDKVLLAHGGGGKLMQDLIEKIFRSQFDNPFINQQGDSAVFNVESSRLAFTTDSYVVRPLFFPGGNIGELAVYGTVNDLSVAGAKPLYISTGFIIEEGLPIEDLWQIVLSMKKAAEKAGVQIVTGDTKVVERGKGDKVFINTSGIGAVYDGVHIAPENCRPGDLIILNGRIAEHGIAIMSAREGLEFETEIKSDSAPLNGLVESMLEASDKIKTMRDATRGGIASALNEIADAANLGIEIYEESLPLDEQTAGACEILGLDPLYIANEGKLLAFVAPEDAEKVLEKALANPFGKDSKIIGKVVDEHPKRVIMKTSVGTNRIVDMISGEQLPRIC